MSLQRQYTSPGWEGVRCSDADPFCPSHALCLVLPWASSPLLLPNEPWLRNLFQPVPILVSHLMGCAIVLRCGWWGGSVGAGRVVRRIQPLELWLQDLRDPPVPSLFWTSDLPKNQSSFSSHLDSHGFQVRSFQELPCYKYLIPSSPGGGIGPSWE